jgi:hypothetical protein
MGGSPPYFDGRGLSCRDAPALEATAWRACCVRRCEQENAAGVSELSDPAHDRALEEGVLRRAWRDSTRGAQTLTFFLVTLLFDATAAVVSILVVASDASPAVRAAAAAGAVLAGTVVALIALFIIRLVRTPFVQRNESRTSLRRARGLDEEPDPRQLAEEFAEFVQVVEASRPRQNFTSAMLFDLDRESRARSDDAYRRAADEARRDALAQYQARFRRRILRVLERHGQSGFYEVHRATAAAPNEIWDLQKLEDAMKRLVAGAARSLAERLDEADALRAKFETQHVTNSRDDYERWRARTELIVAEQSDVWAEAFGRQLDPSTDDPASVEQLRARLDWDQARLREFAAGRSHER